MTDPCKPSAEAPILESLADIEAFEQQSLAQQFPHSNSYALFQQSARLFGDDTAIEFLLGGHRDEPTQRLSFRELAGRITQTANLLHSLGVRPGTTVSVLLPTLLQSHPIIWGTQAAGIVNPINPLLEADHIADIIEAAQSEVLICLAPSAHSNLWEKVQSMLPRLARIHTVLFVSQALFTQDDASLPAHPNIRVLNYNEAITQHSAEHLISGRQFAASQIAASFHTGGTTGHPKIAQLSHGNMAFLGQLMRVYTVHLPRHTILCGLPLFHIYGVIIQGIAAFAIGHRVVLLTPAGFRSTEGMKNFWYHIERFRVRSFSAVPTVLMALSQIPVGDADIRSLKSINSGAAPLSPGFEQRFEATFDVAVSNGYGMTETTALIARAPSYQPPGSVGIRLPYSGVRIVHLSDGNVSRECPPLESGVILVKGPQVFTAYKAEADNATAWVDGDWFNTGDLGYLDEQGFLYLSGRAKDLIIRGGHNIDPAIIEECLSAHPAVAACIAIGMPDAYAGELPMAFVVLKQGHACSAGQLQAFAEEHMTERAAIPKRIEFIDAMPLTAVGKIFRPALRQLITERVLREMLQEHGIKATVAGCQDKQKGLLMQVTANDEKQLNAARELLTALPVEMVFHTA